MKKTFTIIIADRNGHIRNFMERELLGEGYRVKVAKDASEVHFVINSKKSSDLLIIDLDMPHGDGLSLLEWLNYQKPALPVIIHTFHSDYKNYQAVSNVAAFVEKTGDNIDVLKDVVARVLQKYYPRRIPKNGNSLLISKRIFS